MTEQDIKALMILSESGALQEFPTSQIFEQYVANETENSRYSKSYQNEIYGICEIYKETYKNT